MGSITSGPRAIDAWYDSTARRLVLELSGGYQLSIPLKQLKEIASAAGSALAEVEVVGGGHVLHWGSLDADYSVAALLFQVAGPASVLGEASRTGKSRSKPKTTTAAKKGRGGGSRRTLKRT